LELFEEEIYNLKLFRPEVFWRKFRKWIPKMVESTNEWYHQKDSVPQELSNEWSCQYVSTILNVWGNFCVLPWHDENWPLHCFELEDNSR
jgi:hypothetical protein